MKGAVVVMEGAEDANGADEDADACVIVSAYASVYAVVERKTVEVQAEDDLGEVY
jgi:hypothetical protein